MHWFFECLKIFSFYFIACMSGKYVYKNIEIINSDTLLVTNQDLLP